MYFPGRLRLYLEWNWAMFFPPDIAHLRFTRTREAHACRPIGDDL